MTASLPPRRLGLFFGFVLLGWMSGASREPPSHAQAAPGLPVRVEPASRLADLAGVSRALAAPIEVPVESPAERGTRSPSRMKIPLGGAPSPAEPTGSAASPRWGEDLHGSISRGQPARKLTTCRELASAHPGELTPADPADHRPLLSERVHCRALLWIGEARPSRQSFLGPLPLAMPAVGTWPAELMFRSGRGPAGSPSHTRPPAGRSWQSRSWQSIDPSLHAHPVRAHPPALRLRGRGYEALVSIYARGDFDGDGLEDALVRRDAHARKGSYQELALFLLTRTAPDGPLEVRRSFFEAY